jgi:hypothetical protein
LHGGGREWHCISPARLYISAMDMKANYSAVKWQRPAANEYARRRLKP